MKKNLLFILLLLLISWAYYYPHVLIQRPMSFHQWRQCDALMITKNYMADYNFLHPKIHDQLGIEGKMVGEFPIYYFVTATFYKIFGEHEFILRLLNLLTFYIGMVFLFRLCFEILKDFFWASAIAISFFASPLIAYYANNFLPDVSAVSIDFIGLYYFFRYSQSDKKKYLIVASLFFALVGLLKITALIPLIIIGVITFVETFFPKIIAGENWLEGGLKNHKNWLLFALPSLCFIAWVKFANQYNSVNQNTYFLLQPKSFFTASMEDKQNVFGRFMWEWFAVYLNKFSLSVFAIAFVVLLFSKSHNKNNNRIKLLLVLLFAFIIIDFILFFQQFYHHDYYAVVLLIFLPAVLFAIAFWFKNAALNFIAELIFKTAVLFLLFFNVVHARHVMHVRYYGEKSTSIFDAYKFKEKKLKQLGCNEQDKIISVGDPSTGISLYLLNRHGYTISSDLANDSNFNLLKKNQVKFLVANSQVHFDSTTLQKYNAQLLWKNDTLSVFSLR